MDFHDQSKIWKVEHIQERALRFVFRDLSLDYNTLLHKANMFSLQLLKKMVIENFKVVNDFAPVICQPCMSNV